MDSELLSIFHDEQYETNFTKYDENYWPVGNGDTFATNLSENLGGILPISPLEEKIAYFDNDLNCNNYSGLRPQNVNFEEEGNLIYEDYLGPDQSVEIISVNPNDDFDDDESGDEKNNYNSNNINECCQRNYIDYDEKSEVTFRSRTDSSSIADYESHSSDESHFEDDSLSYQMAEEQPIFFDNNINEENKDVNDHKKNSQMDQDVNLISHIDFVGNSIMVATNNSNDAIEIDTENFDLTTFIIDDNFIKEKILENFNPNESHSLLKTICEDDEIVDIETVDDYTNNCSNNDKKISPEKYANTKLVEIKEIQRETSMCNNNLLIEDDVQGDPSWNPGTNKISKLNPQKSVGKPNKLLETKTSTKIQAKTKSPNNQSFMKKLQKQMQTLGAQNKKPIPNNLQILTQNQKDNIKNPNSSNCLMNSSSSFPKIIKSENADEKLNLNQKSDKINLLSDINVTDAVPKKKKLNLEEYYKKRKGENESTPINPIQNGPKKEETKNNDKNEINIKNKQNNCQAQNFDINTKNHSLLIPKETKFENKARLDPISEARNKVLRMQEMKRKAAAERLIDITVSSKVGPITKILPLEQIVKTSTKLNEKELPDKNKNKIEYEEIIIVSTSCNTDIQIPPKFDDVSPTTLKDNRNPAALLYNISNTIEKVKTNENLKISNNSLITSIKTVVLQKTVQDLPNKTNNHNLKNYETNEHGEDKIIMHLPKNRVKQKTCNASIQTNPLPEFPAIDLIIPLVQKTQRNNAKHKRRKYRCNRKRENSISTDSENDKSIDINVDHPIAKTLQTNRNRSHSRSTNGSEGHSSRHISPSYDNFSDCKNQTSILDSTSGAKYKRSRRKKRYENDFRNRNENYSGSDHSSSSVDSYRSRSSCDSYSDRSLSRSSRSRSNERIKNYENSKSRLKFKIYRRSKNNPNYRENLPAVEERRIVYVGRIEPETTKEDLKRKFITYGNIKQITLHYKDTGMKYGFVTFVKAADAFKAIDNGNTDPKISMYDISFGGRRAFCRQSYADLDSAATNTFQLYPYASVPSSRSSIISNNDAEDSFEALLNKVKEKLSSTKSSGKKI